MNAYITAMGSYLPNRPVSNEEMEEYLGLIEGKPSRVKNVVLRQNGIKTRYYALDKQHRITHTNAEIAANSVKSLGLDLNLVDTMVCATSNADQLIPSQASMVHGLLKNKPMELYSTSGVCLSGIQALKTAYLSVISKNSQRVVCSASEMPSPSFLNGNYDVEYELAHNIGKEPYMAFEKDFLRFMLSDGAGAALLENRPQKNSLRIDWIDMVSYAHELPTCMYCGAEIRKDGELKGWKEFESEERGKQSVFVLKQNIRVLKAHVIPYWVDHVETCFRKHNIIPETIDYMIPHVSSMFFWGELLKEFQKREINLDESKWFTNLQKVGNIGSASIFVALEELFKSGKLKLGNTILLLVPESGRFSYGTVHLTVI